MRVSIRPAQTEDGPAQQRIEIAAGKRFEDVGMPEIAGMNRLPSRRLLNMRARGKPGLPLTKRIALSDTCSSP
jgi:hypothetical protein